MSIFNDYLHRFTHFRQGGTKDGKAPHKPVFVLTLIEMVENKLIAQNAFYVEADFVALFKENALLLCQTSYLPDFAMPFFHLQKEGYWTVRLFNGSPYLKFNRSLSILNDLQACGVLDAALFALLQNPTQASALRQAIVEKYFPAQAAAYWQAKQQNKGYRNEQTQYVLNEAETTYSSPSKADTTDEETAFVRGGLFKKLVPQLYDYTCAISGMKLIFGNGNSLVDACHIVPFSFSGDDTVANGIALCPNLHRAFDRGLITISPDYKIVVSSSFTEEENNVYALHRFHEKNIQLPFGQKHYPAAANLAWHQKNIFKP